MSFFYDRDQNVTGTIPASFTFTPSYGMQVSFYSELAEYNSVDNYLYTMPKGLNHLQMQISMPFENRKEEQARQIVGFFESLQGTGFFTYTDPAQIYKPISLFVNSIDNTYNENDLYNINISANTDQSSTLLNWNNSYLTGSNIKGNWAVSTAYTKYDVVRYTGNATYPSNTGNMYDSFYYCKQSHTSQSTLNPASVDNINWSKEFFFQPTYSTQVSKETSVIKTELPYSFTKRTNFGFHANTLKQFKLDFKGISDAETRCILHFLISRQGYKRFQYKIPKIYNQYKIFFAPQWSHTFVYKNVNDISITLIEDPIGKDMNELENITTNGLKLYFEASNTASFRTGTSTWYDLSGGNNYSTISGTPSFSAQNKGFFALDGIDDYIDFYCPGLTTTATIEVWANLKSINSKMIMGWMNYDVYFIPSGGGFNTGNGDVYGITSAQINSLNCIGNWKHYIFEMRSDVSYTNNKIYINGQLQTLTQIVSTENSGSRNFNSGNGRIAGWRSDNNYRLDMDLGSFRIYNRSLSSAEILQNFNAGKERFKIYG